MIGFLKGIKIDYYAILTASLNKECLRFEFIKKTAPCATYSIKCLVFLKE
jgi:hypothetical protein